MNSSNNDKQGGPDPLQWPRPTNFQKRFATNIPAGRPNPDATTGVRRKVLKPPIPRKDDQMQPPAWEQEKQGCPHDDPARKLKKLIRQETRDIESSKKYISEAKCAESKTIRTFRELANRHQPTLGTESLLDSELDPEMAASLLQSEEEGAILKYTPPAALYGRLFREDRNKPRIKVTAASKKKRGVVIPTNSGFLHEEQLMEDLDPGVMDYYELGRPKKTEDIPKPIEHEAEGNVDQILGVTESQDVHDNERHPFSYLVNSEPPVNGNYLQLRGSEPPPWFAGYWNINAPSPDLNVTDNPNAVLENNWINMGPKQISSPYGNILLGRSKPPTVKTK